MAKVRVTWLGDEDASVAEIVQFGQSFTKGKPVEMDEGNAVVAKLSGNPAFSIEAVRAGRPQN